MANGQTIERTTATVQAEIAALEARSRELGEQIQAARRSLKPDFAALAAIEAERNHIGATQLPLLVAELIQVRKAETQARFEALDAERIAIQSQAHALNVAVNEARKLADAGPPYGVAPASAAYARLCGERFIALADAIDAAEPVNTRQTELERQCQELRAIIGA